MLFASQVPDLDSGDFGEGSPTYPMAVGYLDEWEIYGTDLEPVEWRDYRHFDNEFWRSGGCLLQVRKRKLLL